jgi:hypothetical protein
MPAPTNHLSKSIEGILAIFKTGTKAYPGSWYIREPSIVLDELEEYIVATATSPGIKKLVNILMSFDGKNGAGACTATGLEVGDVVLSVAGLTAGALGDASSSFESTITVDDEIQQSLASDLSANDYLATIYRS